MKIISCLFAMLMLSASVCADGVVVSSDSINDDVVYLVPDEHSNSYGYYVKRFDSYACGTSNAYIYNDGGSSSDSAGALRIRGMDRKSIAIIITGMGDAGTNTVGLFVANGTSTPSQWSTVYEAVYNGTTTDTIEMVESFDYCRIGIKRSGTGSANFTVKETYSRVWKQ